MSLLLRYRKLGFAVTLRVDAPELEDLAMDLHSSALEDVSSCTGTTSADLVWQGAPKGGWQIFLKGQAWESKADSPDFLYLQSDSLLDDLIRERLGDFPLLHAGAIADQDGRAVVICGPSGSGKTSLILSCMRKGWDWLSDEMLCFRQPDSLITQGFPRNFNLKQRSFGEFPETSGLARNREFQVKDGRRQIRFIDPNTLPGARFARAGSVRAFILPTYSSTAEIPEIAPLSGSALVQHLAPEMRSSQLPTFAWLAEIGRTVPAYTLRYCSPRSAAECLTDLMNRE